MVYRSTTLKKGLSLLLSIFLILPLFTTTAYAYEHNATAGTGSDAETITDGTGFVYYKHLGFRISILSGNQPFPGVAQPVQDMWFNSVPDADNYIKTNRLGMEAVGTNNIIGKDNLDKINIPYPILNGGSEGGLKPNGIEVRQYLLGGAGGSSGGPGGTGGGPTINWGGDSTPTRSDLAEKYGIEKNSEERAIQLAKYYNTKLYNYYSIVIRNVQSENAITPAKFHEQLKSFYNDYERDIVNKFSPGGEWNVYEGAEGYILEILQNQVSSLYVAYRCEYDPLHQDSHSTRVKGAYVKEGDIISIDKADIPLADATEGTEGSGLDDVPLTQIIMALFSDKTDEGEQKLADAINADPDFRIMLETLVVYYPRKAVNGKTGDAIGIRVVGTAKNIADFNLKNGSLLGGVNGAGMQDLTNKPLPKSLMLEKDDTVLNLLMPKDPGKNVPVPSSEIAGNTGWGTHIYTKGDASTHTWDKDTYPDGTPGPAPDPGTPGNPGDTPDPEDPASPGDPSNPSNPNGSYNITIIKFYESNNVPESNFTREHNPGTIAVEDEPIYHLVDWFYSPDRIDPPSQSTSYDDTKVQALVTGTGTSEATVNVVTPDTTLYLKLVKQDKAPANPTQQFILKESEVTKAYNSQQVQAGASWPTGDIFHWAGDSLGSGKCTEIIGYTCDCDDDDCSGCVQLTFPCSTDII